LILPKPCAATMLWDYGQRLKDLEPVSKTLMLLDRYVYVCPTRGAKRCT